jgi:hypothetical protein
MMSHPTTTGPALGLGDLQDALRAAFDGAVLVPTWVLREVIAHDRLEESGLFVPRRRYHVIDRRTVLALARRERLPIDDVPPGPSRLALLPRPDGNWLASTPAPTALRHYWRLLFCARVSAEIREKLGLPGAWAVNLRQAAEHLGRGGFREIHLILHEERLVSNRATEADVYCAFTVVFLELFYFDRPMLRRFFPGILETAPVLESIAQSIDADGLWRKTFLAGAAAPPAFKVDGAGGHGAWEQPRRDLPSEADDDQSVDPNRGGLASRKEQQALLAAADRATAHGNDVRAAVLHTQAFGLGGARAGVNHAGRDLDALAARLASIRELGPVTALEWRQALRPVLACVARQWWNQQARLLYDLQKVCVETEQEAYSVNLVEWALDFGRRPLRRPLRRQRLVLMVKHLHGAQGRLTRMHLAAVVRARLSATLLQAAHAAELNLHQQLYPVVLSTLRDSGLAPGCEAEIVAEHKLVEELLDAVARKGFLSLGDLRDAISRNAIKLDDLSGPGEFLSGDPLLRIDQRLAVELDGIYRRGEVYRRMFQRVSSLLYADRFGRFLTRTLLIPLGGAFLVLEGLEHTVGLVIHLIFKVHPGLGAGFHGLPKHGGRVRGWKVPGLKLWVDHPFRYLAVAALFFLLTNWPMFRETFARTMRQLGRALHWGFVGLPEWLLSRPLVRAIARSHMLRLGLRYVVKPLGLAWLTWLALPRSLGVVDRASLGGGAFLAANLLLNSRRVRALEGALLHNLRIGWERLTGNILAGLYRMLMGFFEQMLEDIDRMLYQVDEWLRFRSGQGKLAFAVKALLGVCWFYVAYFVRFVINLLVEPQINPIKHFPVVTVSHKIILPQAPRLADALEALGMARARALSLAVPIIFLIPGMFGFLAWELLSNWKLYKANRPPALRPVQVGSHGESLARLLRPGAHSGTIPKIFARLRRAAGRGRSGRRTQKQLHALEHAREDVEHFLNRELIERLNRHPAWKQTPVSLGEVTLTPTSIAVDLLIAGWSPHGAGEVLGADLRPMRISFGNWAGLIVAGVDEIGWAADLFVGAAAPLRGPQSPLIARMALSLALAGLYKFAAVDLVREQVDSVLRAAFPQNAGGIPFCWDVRPGTELLVRWDAREKVEAVYSLADGALRPKALAARKPVSDRSAGAEGSVTLPTLDSGKLMLRHMPISWANWVAAWEPGAQALAFETALNGARVLPDVRSSQLAPVEA